MDTRGQLQQSAKDLRQMADKERISKSTVQKDLDKLKMNVQTTHNQGMSAGNSEQLVAQLDRQVKDMQKEIDNLERQARDIDKQSKRF